MSPNLLDRKSESLLHEAPNTRSSFRKNDLGQFYRSALLFVIALFMMSFQGAVYARDWDEHHPATLFRQQKVLIFSNASGEAIDKFQKDCNSVIAQWRSGPQYQASFQVLPLEELGAHKSELANPNQWIVFLVVRNTAWTPESYRDFFLPELDLSQLRPNECRIHSKQKRGKGDTAFHILLTAPTPRLLLHLIDTFIFADVNKFLKNLHLSEQYDLVAVITNDDATLADQLIQRLLLKPDPDWLTLPFDKIDGKDRELELRDELYLINRGKQPSALPILQTRLPAAAANLGENEVLISLDSKPSGTRRLVISSPDSLHLRREIQDLSAMSQLSSFSKVKQLCDLRSYSFIALSPLLDKTAKENKENSAPSPLSFMSGKLESLLSQKLGSRLQLRSLLKDVLAEKAFNESGFVNTDDARGVADKLPKVDALMVGEVFSLSTRTDGAPRQARITPAPQPFSEARPSEPGRNDRQYGFFGPKIYNSDEEFKAAHDKWQYEDLPRWETKSRRYQEDIKRREYLWSRWIEETSDVEINGALKIISLKPDDNFGKLLWSGEFHGTAKSQRNQQERTYTQQGPTEPNLTQPGYTLNEAPQNTINTASIDALSKCLAKMEREILLPSLTGESVAPGGESRVVSIEGGTIWIKIGQDLAGKLNTGTGLVAVWEKEVKDSHQVVIETIRQEIKLSVKKVYVKSAECTLVNSDDLEKIKPDQLVKLGE